MEWRTSRLAVYVAHARTTKAPIVGLEQDDVLTQRKLRVWLNSLGGLGENGNTTGRLCSPPIALMGPAVHYTCLCAKSDVNSMREDRIAFMSELLRLKSHEMLRLVVICHSLRMINYCERTRTDWLFEIASIGFITGLNFKQDV
uniref:Uncharacterized protein n=1 Tax=Setaria digitata TaxID=48799 RepID=A0A915PIT8_9BILA